jgi:putative oxidoreductase
MITKEQLTNSYENFFAKIGLADGLAPLIIRLIVGPVMIVAGFNKLGLSSPDATFLQSLLADPSVVSWFGNSERGLGLPFPDLMAFLAGWSEFLGGWFIVLGLLTRFAAIPLMFTMIVAATSVHWHNGWYAVAPADGSTSPTLFYNWLGFEQAKQSSQNAEQVSQRLSEIRHLIKNSENPDWVSEKGPVAILNNGIEWSTIYFVMLLSLFFQGGGRFTSLDYWIKRSLFK